MWMLKIWHTGSIIDPGTLVDKKHRTFVRPAQIMYLGLPKLSDLVQTTG